MEHGEALSLLHNVASVCCMGLHEERLQLEEQEDVHWCVNFWKKKELGHTQPCCTTSPSSAKQKPATPPCPDAHSAGRVTLYLTAAHVHCGSYDRKSTNCSFPCEDNGEVCALSGSMAAATYACNGSQVGWAGDGRDSGYAVHNDGDGLRLLWVQYCML